MSRRKDTPEKERRGPQRRHRERRHEAAPVLMNTRVPTDRRAGERREPDAAEPPVDADSGGGERRRDR